MSFDLFMISISKWVLSQTALATGATFLKYIARTELWSCLLFHFCVSFSVLFLTNSYLMKLVSALFRYSFGYAFHQLFPEAYIRTNYVRTDTFTMNISRNMLGPLASFHTVLAIRPGRPWPTQILVRPTQIVFWPNLAVGLPKVIVLII